MPNGNTIKERLMALEVKMKLIIWLLALMVLQIPALIIYALKIIGKNLFAR